jgi:hypothetical protein
MSSLCIVLVVANGDCGVHLMTTRLNVVFPKGDELGHQRRHLPLYHTDDGMFKSKYEGQPHLVIMALRCYELIFFAFLGSWSISLNKI